MLATRLRQQRRRTTAIDSFLGIDLGTSSLKVALVDADGHQLAGAEAGYRVDSPQPGWAQTDTREWDTALDAALTRIAPALASDRPRAVSVTGQMHGAVLCDNRGAAVRPAILWPDRRAVDLLGRWRALPETVRARLANPLVAGMTGPVMAWLAEHEPATVARAAWLGMTAGTAREDLVRAAVEAMAFTVCRAVDLLGAGGRPVRLTGGGSRSDLVAQLLADALHVPVRRMTVPAASATGAAILAARGVGVALPPAAEHGSQLEPHPAPALRVAYQRWLDRLAAGAAGGG